MLIAIPSKGRPSGVKTQRYLGGRGVVFVPDLEVAAYQRCGVENVIGVPNDVRGITATRNWILDHTDERWVVFVDDDVVTVAWAELLGESAKWRKLDAETVVAEFVKLFEVTEQAGYRIWGASSDGALRSVYPYRPFIWNTYVTASCMGMLNGPQPITGKPPLRFDEEFITREDYELGLRAYHEDGGIVGARFFCWRNEHWSTPGGCRDYRSADLEMKMIRKLQRRYPGQVQHKPNAASPYSIAIHF